MEKDKLSKDLTGFGGSASMFHESPRDIIGDPYIAFAVGMAFEDIDSDRIRHKIGRAGGT